MKESSWLPAEIYSSRSGVKGNRFSGSIMLQKTEVNRLDPLIKFFDEFPERQCENICRKLGCGLFGAGMNLYQENIQHFNMNHMTEKLDYSTEGFTMPIQRGSIKTYASVNVEMYYDDQQLEPTGHYFIYLLHPLHGSCHFIIEQVIATSNWFSKNAPPFVENDIIQEIGTAINFSKQQRNLTSKRQP